MTFDKDDPKWAAEYKELAELLTPEEYRQARASVNDAFYTSPTIIDGIYEALGNFGFDGGSVLEPAMGIGNFFGRMPEDMQAHSQLYGVEIDSLSGRIAQALYHKVDLTLDVSKNNILKCVCCYEMRGAVFLAKSRILSAGITRNGTFTLGRTSLLEL